MTCGFFTCFLRALRPFHCNNGSLNLRPRAYPFFGTDFRSQIEVSGGFGFDTPACNLDQCHGNELHNFVHDLSLLFTMVIYSYNIFVLQAFPKTNVGIFCSILSYKSKIVYIIWLFPRLNVNKVVLQYNEAWACYLSSEGSDPLTGDEMKCSRKKVAPNIKIGNRQDNKMQHTR